MTARRPVAAARVGRPHGLDGSFHLVASSEPLAAGDEVVVAGRSARVASVRGGGEIVRLEGVSDRSAAEAIRGETLHVLQSEQDLTVDEYFADDLVGCDIDGIGPVRRVVRAPSCDLLEVGDERLLVPLVRDAVRAIDLGRRRIEVDRDFLGL